MTFYRRAVKRRKLVYVICTPRPNRYARGRSRVIYIGTTKKGVHRVASSMAGKAISFLERRGIKQLDVYLVVCPPRPGTPSWSLLEHDLLVAFRINYGEQPFGNQLGKNFGPDGLSRLFKYSRLANVLATFEK